MLVHQQGILIIDEILIPTNAIRMTLALLPAHARNLSGQSLKGE